jgi:hypothetical protein
MAGMDWVHGPFGPYGAEGRTCEYERTVLVVVHTVTAGTRLADVVPLLEPDPRVQVVYTWPPWSLVSAGTGQFLDRLGAVVVPWRQAVQVRFDLAIAASYGLLEQLHAPVLTVSHGLGFSKYPPVAGGAGPRAPREPAGLERGELIWRGRVIPSVIAVPTRRDLGCLERWCPEAAPAGLVAGDPCYDRLAVSLPRRAAYRQALGTAGRTLVAVSSTWGPGSLAALCPDLLPQMMRELPASEYQVAAIVHPNAWHWHGQRQIRAWLSACVRRGMVLVPPEEGWRAVLAAADLVVGDHGSVTCYGASAGVPVLLGAFPGEHVVPDSAVAELGRTVARLEPGQPVVPQLRRAALAWPPGASASLRSRITDVPGQSARILRSVMYELMDLPEPDACPEVVPVPVPGPAAVARGFGVAG